MWILLQFNRAFLSVWHLWTLFRWRDIFKETVENWKPNWQPGQFRIIIFTFLLEFRQFYALFSIVTEKQTFSVHQQTFAKIWQKLKKYYIDPSARKNQSKKLFSEISTTNFDIRIDISLVKKKFSQFLCRYLFFFWYRSSEMLHIFSHPIYVPKKMDSNT